MKAIHILSVVYPTYNDQIPESELLMQTTFTVVIGSKANKPPSGLRLPGNVQSGSDIAYESDILLLILLPRAAQIRDILEWFEGLADRQHESRPLLEWRFSNIV